MLAALVPADHIELPQSAHLGGFGVGENQGEPLVLSMKTLENAGRRMTHIVLPQGFHFGGFGVGGNQGRVWVVSMMKSLLLKQKVSKRGMNCSDVLQASYLCC